MAQGRTNSVFGGLQGKVLHTQAYSLTPSSFSDAFAEKTITLATPVEDYTKCIVLVKGVFPYMVGFTLNPMASATQYPYQIVFTEAYARMTANNTIKFKLAWTEPVVGYDVGDYSTGLVTSGYNSTSFVIEVIELHGIKSLTYQEIINTNQGTYLNPGSAPAGANPEKCIVIYQGGFLLVYNSTMEYKVLNGYVTSDLTLTYFVGGAMFSTGGGAFVSNKRLGVYIIESY